MKKIFFTLLSAVWLLTLNINITFANPQNINANSSSAASYIPQNTYISPIKTAPMIFTGLGVSWHQKIPLNTTAQIDVRFMNNNIWGDWYTIEADIDGTTSANYEYPASFLPVNATQTFQYKVILQSKNPEQTPLIENIEFTYINAAENKKVIAPKEIVVASIKPTSSSLVSSTANVPTFKTMATSSLSTASNEAVRIISRAEWGADESLRVYKSSNTAPVLVQTETDFGQKYAAELKIVKVVDKDQNGSFLTWPLQYPETIKKIIVHHTATTKDLEDPAKAIRDIYYFHTVTRGWGDIGYNYIIDPKGNIYEGRFGGDSVVGAHAGKGNIGSIGISILGNYQDNEVPAPVMKSLLALIKLKTKEYNIDPVGTSLFRGENIPNIVGHRDIMATSCPGENLYNQLPALRLAVKGGYKATIIDRGMNLEVNKKNDFSVVGEIPFFQFEPGVSRDIDLTLKNTGSTVWGKGTYFALNKDKSATTFFSSDGLIKSNALVAEIKPGETGSFKIKLQAGYVGGLAAIEVFPMINGTVKVEKYLSIPVQISQSNYDYEVQSVTISKNFLKKGMQAEAVVTMKNTGNITWKKSGNGKFTLGADTPRDHTNKILLNPGNRLADLEETEVAPGGIGHFKIKLKAPDQVGPYHEYFTPLLEGITWLANKNNALDIYVYDKDYAAQFQNESAKNIVLVPGILNKVSFKLQNQGGLAWTKSSSLPLNIELRNTNFSIKNVSLAETTVDPGKEGTVNFEIQAPTTEGNYTLRLMPKLGNNDLLPKLVNVAVVVSKQKNVIPQNPVSPVSNSPVQSSTTTNKPIRIDLSFHGNPMITGTGSYTLYEGTQSIATFPKNQLAEVTANGNQYKVLSGGKTYELKSPPRFVPLDQTILRIDNFERRPSWSPTLNDNEYRGILEVRSYNGQLHTINELPLEVYLKGLGEIDEKQPKEKIRTIIILARSYANFYMNVAEKFPGAPFHLTDDPETSQKYVGYSFEKRSPNTVQAVKDTENLIVTYQGKPIKTPYFSSDDGRTRSAEEVWGWKDTPYLVSVDDPYCKGKALWGHGVGLSGCGSLGMAQAGKGYQEIIKYYYKGVEIVKLN